MQQIQNVWSSLDTRRRLIAVLAAGAVFAAILTMTRMASQPSLSLLYSGLENGAAGEVVEALERRGVPYEVRGGSIFVDGTRRDELRMTLASEGLPMNSAKGYELLDSLSGFGTTSQMFDAAYWRAKEGELARTIVSSPLISNARVHIANVGSNPFQQSLKPSASVSVMAVNGSVSATEAKALKYLVASAVAGLSPDDVAVIDSKGGLVASGDDVPRDAIGQNRADALRARVRNMLEALVGNGNAVVEVSVETETESESIHEKRFDPAGRVAISTETEERSNKSTDAASGDVTVASNLPEGDAANGENTSNQGNQTRERVNYEVSETRREVIRQPGAIKRLSVAVLVNGISATAADGTTTVTPRTDAELAELRELVASAVGFDEARGDVITIKSMAFEPVAEIGSAPRPGFFARLHLDVMSIIQLAVLALVTLVLGLFVLRPILSRGAVGERPALAPPQGGAAGVAEAGAPEPLTGEIADGQEDFPEMAVISDGRGVPGGETGPGGASMESSAERLRALIGERQDETMEILRNWLEPHEESA